MGSVTKELAARVAEKERARRRLLDLAPTTFGHLEPVNENDNSPVGLYAHLTADQQRAALAYRGPENHGEDWARRPATDVAAGYTVDTAGNIRPALPARGLYLGLVRADAGEPARYGGDLESGIVVVHPGTRPASTDSGQFHGDNPHMEMTPEERLPGALKLLAAKAGYIYLGSPYSKYEAGHDAAARVVADAAASLMRRGLVIYSPIAHGHAVAAHGLPLEWDFWKRQCQPLVDSAAGLIVLTMTGWRDSVGLQYEIEEFVRTGRPLLHVSPAWLAASEVGRVG